MGAAKLRMWFVVREEERWARESEMVMVWTKQGRMVSLGLGEQGVQQQC